MPCHAATTELALTDDAAYQVLLARDARYDGRFYVGVTSTGVYCRPICRVRTPLRRNCCFFATAARAEAAAFRPCLKCRPEIAPNGDLPWTVMDAARTLARQASAVFDTRHTGCDEVSVASVAERLGVSDRHLRRIFVAEHGVTPMQYLQTRRLLLSKQLLTDTALPVADIAHASGYRSIRRFNAAFVASYRMAPGRLRRAASVSAAAAMEAATPAASVAVRLAYRAPFDTAGLLRFLAHRAIPGVEAVVDGGVRRSVRAGAIGTAAGWVEAQFVSGAAAVVLRYAPALAADSGRVIAAARRWLDLDAEPHTIDAALADLPGAPGVRLPGSLDAFELAVRAVLGQQITVAAARTLAGRLVERHGTPQATPWVDVQRAFPSPDALASLALDDIAGLGIIRTRAAAIVALARCWPDVALLLAAPCPSPDRLITRLCAIPGIGLWTAHYTAMRTLGWTDAYPPGDVALAKALRRWGLTDAGRPAAIDAHLAWQPWRSYAVLRLWASLDGASAMSPRDTP